MSVYVFDRCINLNSGILAEGPSNCVQLLVFVC